MGIFDYVEFIMDCPKCGAKINGFQTKDGDPDLHTVDFVDVSNFYSECDECGVWIEFNRKKAKSIKDYKMKITPKREPSPLRQGGRK